MSDEERRERQMEFILNLQAELTEKMLQAEKRMDQADKRMDRLERVLLMAIRAGRRERREWREHYQALVEAQMRAEESAERYKQEWHERYNALVEAQMRAEEAAERDRQEWRARYNVLVEAQTRSEETAERDRQEWHARHVALIDSHNALVQSQMQTEALTRRNSEDIGRLERMVERIVTSRNGDGAGGEGKA